MSCMYYMHVGVRMTHQFNFYVSYDYIFGDFQSKNHKHVTTRHAKIQSIAMLISVRTEAVQVSGMKNK